MKSPTLQIGNFRFDWGSRTYVMGILNVTPDSFSGDGLLAQTDAVDYALKQAEEFIANGADILDVGGESTRPGSAAISAEEELRRVIPVIQALHKNFPNVLISIDTYKAQVAEEALKAGAKIINDVWGLRADAQLAQVAAQYQALVILMHNRSNPASVEVREKLGGTYLGAEYTNLIEDVKRELLASVALAKNAGVADALIVLDPGIGFGKKREDNLRLINHLHEIRALGYPILLGASRKSFIGYTLDLPADQRLEGTASAIAIGIARGADLVRVHDVQAMSRVARMTDALVRANYV
ncbi:MAG: dihydropteroate synthase [Anaerolineales bacterium]|nr:dihydropteroate synthase [Anaerolineales bacterium]